MSTASPTFSAVQLDAKHYAVIVKASRELIESSPTIEAALERALATKLALVLDQAVLTGSGASDPTGITNFSGGINSYSVNAKMSDWSPYAEGIALCALDNADAPDTAVMGPKVWADHTTEMTDTTGQPLRRPSTLEDLRLMQTTSCPATSIIMGGFEEIIIGLRKEVRVEVLRERYVDNLQYGFLAYISLDLDAENEEGLCILDTITT